MSILPLVDVAFIICIPLSRFIPLLYVKHHKRHAIFIGRHMELGCISVYSDRDGSCPDHFELLMQLPKHLVKHFVHPPVPIRDSPWP